MQHGASFELSKNRSNGRLGALPGLLPIWSIAMKFCCRKAVDLTATCVTFNRAMLPLPEPGR
jgi:hypothetical protein